MTNTRLLSAAVALLCAACATAPVTRPAASAAPARPSSPAASLDASEYRKQLEDAYAQIVAREQKPANAPQVDVEAAASIPIPEHRTIRGAVNYFSTDLRDSIQASLTRSARYKKLIDDALAEQKLPKGLAYLPVIESAYVPTLTSRAGAHGIWQFMPDTAREYGLRVDWWVDERADPEKSTKAAAVFLRDLYRQFNDWSLTLAAYNAGPGRIKRALENTGATTFWELLEQGAIPKETRGYVPTFYATLLIASDPSTYGFKLTPPDSETLKRVDVDGPLSLKYLANVSGVGEDHLRELNPALRRGMLPPGRATIRVPSSAADTIVARARTMKNDDSDVAVCSFTIREGDSVKKLARALGTNVETILAMNDVSSTDRIRRGDSIYLPVRGRELGALLRHSEDDDMYYAVRKGDTLYSVARRHDLTVAELRELNDLNQHAKLHPGQKLRISAPKTLTAGGGM